MPYSKPAYEPANVTGGTGWAAAAAAGGLQGQGLPLHGHL